MPGLGGGRSAPVARGAFVLGSLASFWRDPLGTLVEGWRACGDVVRFRFLEGLLPDAYLLAHPDHVRHVLADEPAKYPKDPAQVAKLKAFAGNGLTFVDGELWQRERERMEPGFAITHVEPLAGRIGEASATLAARWEAEVAPGEAIDVAVEMQRLGFELVARLLFDDGDDPAGAAIARASPILLAHAYQGIRFGIAAPDWLPLPSVRRYVRARDAYDELAHRLIARRTVAPDGDLVSLLLRTGSGGRAALERQARDELVTVMLAGHTNIGLTLMWALYLLGRHPEARSRLREELAAVLGGRIPGAQDLPALAYADAVVRETLRLYPIAPVLARRALADDEIGGYAVAASSTVYVSPFVTHRHPEFWPDPERFDPDRFMGRAAPDLQAHAYLPFGLGPRHCIGAAVASLATRLALATLVQAHPLELVPGGEIAPRATLLLDADGPLLMRRTRD